ncbi:hypothetical protein EAF00_003792 [Botryotinia globosa]|nr:hypothetical protein EAF00_003792 [Botryotinia globosa]
MALPTYKVYKIQWHLAMKDPLMPQAIRYHTNIFIETSQDGSGTIYEVNGDIFSASGMSYLKFPSPPPDSFESFYQKTLLGELAVSDLDEHEDGTPYKDDEEVPKFWKCTEWTNEKAIPALWAKGLIKMIDNNDVVGN